MRSLFPLRAQKLSKGNKENTNANSDRTGDAAFPSQEVISNHASGSSSCFVRQTAAAPTLSQGSGSQVSPQTDRQMEYIRMLEERNR